MILASKKGRALVIIVFLSFIAGMSTEMIAGNIRYNEKTEHRLIAVADENIINPHLFRIGDDIFRIERVENISGFVWSDTNETLDSGCP